MSFNHKYYYVVFNFRSVTSIYIYDLYSLFHNGPYTLCFLSAVFFPNYVLKRVGDRSMKWTSSGWSTKPRDWQLMWTFVSSYTLEFWHKTWLNSRESSLKNSVISLIFHCQRTFITFILGLTTKYFSLA